MHPLNRNIFKFKIININLYKDIASLSQYRADSKW